MKFRYIVIDDSNGIFGTNEITKELISLVENFAGAVIDTETGTVMECHDLVYLKEYPEGK